MISNANALPTDDGIGGRAAAERAARPRQRWSLARRIVVMLASCATVLAQYTISSVTSSPSCGTAPLTVNVTVTTVPAVGATYMLNFGDGATGYGISGTGATSHTYTTPGVYQPSCFVFACAPLISCFITGSPVVVDAPGFLSSVVPPAGPSSGGTTVTLNLAGNLNGTSVTGVYFGGVPASNVAVSSPNTISCTTPAITTSVPIAPPILIALGGTNCPPLVGSGLFTFDPGLAIAAALPSNLVPFVSTYTLLGSGFVPGPIGTWANGIPVAALPGPMIAGFDTLSVTLPATVTQSGASVILELTQPAPPSQSRPFALHVSGFDNAGIVTISPLGFGPGSTATTRVTGLDAGTPVLLALDSTPPSVVTTIGAPASHFALELGSPWVTPLIDGIGAFGSAWPPGVASSLGELTFVHALPTPPFGWSAKLQSAWLSPSAPLGYRLTWAFPANL